MWAMQWCSTKWKKDRDIITAFGNALKTLLVFLVYLFFCFFPFSEVFCTRMSCLQSFIAAIEDEKCFMHSAISILKAKALRKILEMQKVRSVFTYSWRSEGKKRVLEQIRVIAGVASSPAVVSHLRTWPLMTVWGEVPVHTACSWHMQQ